MKGENSLPAIGILVLAVDFDVVVYDILAVSDDVEPLRRVYEVQVGDLTSFEAVDCEEDRPYLLSSPYAAISIQAAPTVDIHVAATNLEERYGLLERVLESIGRPVGSIWSEDDLSLDDCSCCYYLRSVLQQLAELTQIDFVELGQIKSLPDRICRPR